MGASNSRFTVENRVSCPIGRMRQNGRMLLLTTVQDIALGQGLTPHPLPQRPVGVSISSQAVDNRPATPAASRGKKCPALWSLSYPTILAAGAGVAPASPNRWVHSGTIRDCAGKSRVYFPFVLWTRKNAIEICPHRQVRVSPFAEDRACTMDLVGPSRVELEMAGATALQAAPVTVPATSPLSPHRPSSEARVTLGETPDYS
jgi:hypothetical protein